MMLFLAVVVACAVAADAIVCPPGMCDGIKAEPLNCKGSVIKNGGYCGCTDACAKVEGEECQTTIMFGAPSSLGTCDKGLICKNVAASKGLLGGGFGRGTCVIASSKDNTKCEVMQRTMSMSMFITDTKWTPQCDDEGNFLPKQCDFSGACFCVSAKGEILTDRKHGDVNCS